jgi:hypothetical protein
MAASVLCRDAWKLRRRKIREIKNGPEEYVPQWKRQYTAQM